VWAAAFVVACVILSGAAPADSLEDEIAHLLETVAESGCTFVRNGSEHSAQSAREHMELKYGHVKRRVRSSEQFIEYAATRSSITGRAYTIRCAGVETPSGEWLGAALLRYRAERAAANIEE
jgi:hypothetical protein